MAAFYGHFARCLPALGTQHSTLESLVVALTEQQRMSRTIHKNAMSIAFFALWHLSLFLSCVFYLCVCVDWKCLGKSTHTHTQVSRMRTGTGNWEMKTGNWERFSSNAFGKDRETQRDTKRTCVGSNNEHDNWARQKTEDNLTQIRCSTTTDCRSRGTQRETHRETERERQGENETDIQFHLLQLRCMTRVSGYQLAGSLRYLCRLLCT